MNYHDRKLAKHEQGLPILAALGLLLALLTTGCAVLQDRKAAVAYAYAGTAAGFASFTAMLWVLFLSIP